MEAIPEKGEKVKVRGIKGTFEFLRFERDTHGDYAVVLGGLKGHRLERCISVDRMVVTRRKQNRKVTQRNVVDVQSDYVS